MDLQLEAEKASTDIRIRVMNGTFEQKRSPKYRFACEYCIDFDPAAALARAGVKRKSKASYELEGKKWLEEPQVQQTIKNIIAKEESRNRELRLRVIRKLVDLGLNDFRKTMDRDRLKALEILCRHLGLLAPVTTEINNTIITNAVNKSDIIAEALAARLQLQQESMAKLNAPSHDEV